MDDFTDAVMRMMAVPISEERPWLVFAACRNADPDLFFPSAREDAAPALAICASCPVQPECLEYAIDAGERFGIWGGMTERDRRKRARQLRRSA